MPEPTTEHPTTPGSGETVDTSVATTAVEEVVEESSAVAKVGSTIDSVQKTMGPLGLAIGVGATAFRVGQDLSHGDQIGAAKDVGAYSASVGAGLALGEVGAELGLATGPAAPIASPVLGLAFGAAGAVGADKLVRAGVDQVIELGHEFAQTEVGQDTIHLAGDAGKVVSDAGHEIAETKAGRFVTETAREIANSAPVQAAEHEIGETAHAIANSAPVKAVEHGLEVSGHYVAQKAGQIANSKTVKEAERKIQEGGQYVAEGGQYVAEKAHQIATSAPVEAVERGLQAGSHYVAETAHDIASSGPVQAVVHKAGQVVRGVSSAVKDLGAGMNKGGGLLDRAAHTEVGQAVVHAGEAVAGKVSAGVEGVKSTLRQSEMGRDVLQIGHDAKKLGSDAVNAVGDKAHQFMNWLSGSSDGPQASAGPVTPQERVQNVTVIDQGLREHFEKNPGLHDIAADYQQAFSDARATRQAGHELGLDPGHVEQTHVELMESAQNSARDDIHQRQSTQASVTAFHTETQDHGQKQGAVV